MTFFDNLPFKIRGKKKHTPPLTFSRPKQTSSKIQKRGDTSPTPPTPNPSNLLGPDALGFSTTWVSHTWNWWVIGEEWWLISWSCLVREPKRKHKTAKMLLCRGFFSLKRFSLKLWINWISTVKICQVCHSGGWRPHLSETREISRRRFRGHTGGFLPWYPPAPPIIRQTPKLRIYRNKFHLPNSQQAKLDQNCRVFFSCFAFEARVASSNDEIVPAVVSTSQRFR